MKKGDKFIHKFFLDYRNQPMLCEITAVRNGFVYYETRGGGKWKMTVTDYIFHYRG